MFTLDAVQIHGGSGYVAEVGLAAIVRALLVPAAPNLAHVWFFALAGIALGGRDLRRA